MVFPKKLLTKKHNEPKFIAEDEEMKLTLILFSGWKLVAIIFLKQWSYNPKGSSIKGQE